MSAVTAADAESPRPGLFILIAISWVAPLGINIFLPSIPTIERAFDVPYATVTLLISLYMIAMAVCQLVLGSLSDRYGRRPVVLIGLALAAIAGFVGAVAPNIEILIASRIVQGAGACAGIVLARAIVRDVYDRRHAASMLGYVTMGMAVAPMVAPLIGGLIDDYVGWRMSFALIGVLATAVTALAYLMLPETAPKAGGRTLVQLLGDFQHLLTVRLFWLYVLVLSLTSGVYFSYVGAAPLISTEVLELSPTRYGAYFMTVAFGYIIGNFLAGRFSTRMGVKWMAVTGCVLGVVGSLIMAGGFVAAGLTVIGLFGPMALIGLSNGMSIPNAMAGAVSVRPDLAGAASGLVGSVQIGVGALMAFIASLLVDRSDALADPMPLMAMSVVLSTLALLFVLPTPKQGAGH